MYTSVRAARLSPIARRPTNGTQCAGDAFSLFRNVARFFANVARAPPPVRASRFAAAADVCKYILESIYISVVAVTVSVVTVVDVAE